MKIHGFIRRFLKLLLFIAVVMALISIASVVFAAPTCNTSDAGSYDVQVCIDNPQHLSVVSGVPAINASVTIIGTGPGVTKLLFSLNGQYLLTEYKSPYVFYLPTTQYIDGTYTLSVVAIMQDGYTSPSTTISLVFNNNISQQPINTNTFTPYTGSPPPPGQSFIVAATGDGASGEWPQVTDLIATWDPHMFLYLGDVYDKGTYTEFYNWYGVNRFFGLFRNITNPIVGNHEYENGVAPGYFNYWDNVPDYYSYNAAGWHFIALNSTSQLGQSTPGTPQYDWMAQDLANNTSACTVVYFHHPLFNIGSQGVSSHLTGWWSFFVQNGVDLVLTGHDHNYQRWHLLDANSNISASGVPHFVLGAGGHGVRPFVTSDSRVAVGIDTSPTALGSLRLALNPNGATYQYINIFNTILDSGTITCNGTPADTTPPTTPTNLSASMSQGVLLNWSPSSDSTAVAGYTVYRNGAAIGTTETGVTTYTDYSMGLNQTYTYRVDAFDPAGNHSALSNAAQITTPASSTLTLTPSADAYVNSDSPNTNFGVSTTLRTDQSPILNSYLRFNVPAITANVVSATLRVYTTANNTAGYTLRTTSNNWGETEITYSNAPSVGTSIGKV